MLKALLIALVAEIVFLVGIVAGSILSCYCAMAFTFIRGEGRLSTQRAILQGVLTGIVAGGLSILVTAQMGRWLSVSESWFVWISIAPPIIGEIGHIMNRYKIINDGKPDKGPLFPIGRMHAAAWAFYFRINFNLAKIAIQGVEPEEVGYYSYHKAQWVLTRAVFGCVIGVAVAILVIRSL